MPVGRILNPGDKVNAPKIGIPGQEIDNPNTVGDDRNLKTVPGQKAIPVAPDFDHDGDPDTSDTDDDNDGKPDTSDSKPKNPYVPTASSTPPPPSNDTPEQSEGEKDVSKVRESYGDFLDKPEHEGYNRRLNVIEEKYRRAAVMEAQNPLNPEAGWLTVEADDELQQLSGEIGEAWVGSLSQYERQLFNNQPQATIDEMQMHMKQWDKGTYNDVAHSILDHSSRKGYKPLDYVRAASNFDKSRARRTPPEGVRPDGTVKLENLSTREFIEVNEEGKIVTYGVNP